MASDLGPQMNTTGTGKQVPIPIDTPDSLSEDSLIFSSPPKKGSRRPRSSSATGRTRAASARPPVPRARAHARRPSPALMAAARNGEHSLVAPADDTAEARLVALEQQQKIDHLYFGQIRAALHNLNDHTAHFSEKFKTIEQETAEHMQMGLQVRRELAHVRDTVDSKVQAMITDIAARLDAKFVGVEAQMAVLQTSVNDQQAYITSLEAQRPKDGNLVKETFVAMDNEVNKVKQMVGHIESNGVFGQGGEVLTKDMLSALELMKNKLDKLNPDIIESSFHRLSATMDVLSHSCAGFHERFAGLEQSDAAGIAPPPPPAYGGRRGTRWATAAPQACGGCDDAACGAPGLGAGHSGNLSDQRLNALIGGNGMCHCIHVSELINKVAKLEATSVEDRRHDRGPDPLQHSGWRQPDPNGGSVPSGTARDPGPGPASPASRKLDLPLNLTAPLGAIGFKDRAIFDDKVANSAEYKFNGTKDGVAWKIKMERYFITRAPVLQKILEFAELEDMNVISVDRFRQAVGHHLTEEQLLNVNVSLWGFLGQCLTGSAETLFDGAETLNGIDAWRRIIRHIDHGREIHLEVLRREMKTLRTRVIKDVQGV